MTIEEPVTTQRKGTPWHASIATLAALIFSCWFGGCSVLPDWSPRESLEFWITAHYGPSQAARTVPLPSSTTDLLILDLSAEPLDLQESYTAAMRELLLPANHDTVQVHCRYRLYRRHDSRGAPLPWLDARALFPGADRIIDHGTAVPNEPRS